MIRTSLAALALATLMLAGCGLRGDPAVPPAKGEAAHPAAPDQSGTRGKRP